MLLLYVGCSSDDAATATSTATSYQGAGSAWNLSIDGSTVTIDESVSGVSVTASSTALSSGIRELTVTAASGTGAPSVGDKAHMILIPGFAAVLKPLAASSDQIIPLIFSGTCPTSDTLMNVVDMNDDAGTDNNNIVAAKLTLSASNFVMNSADTFDPQSAGLGTVAHSCSNSVSEITINGNTSTLYLNAGGGAIVHAKDGAGITTGIYTAVPQMSADIQASDVASKNVELLACPAETLLVAKANFKLMVTFL